MDQACGQSACRGAAQSDAGCGSGLRASELPPDRKNGMGRPQEFGLTYDCNILHSRRAGLVRPLTWAARRELTEKCSTGVQVAALGLLGPAEHQHGRN